MKRLISSILSLTLLTIALSSAACTASQLQQFKTYWSGGVNAVDAFNVAIQANPNVSVTLKAEVQTLAAKLDPTKSVINGLTGFPPANSADLVALLKDVTPILTEIAGNTSVGSVVSIAAASALAFFQTEADMLTVSASPTASPTAAKPTSAQVGNTLNILKDRLKDLQDKVNAVKVANPQSI